MELAIKPQKEQMMRSLCEGLRPLDLADLVSPLLEVDTYKSKMGEDRDVCVVTFKVVDRAPAKDLMEFIEKGFDFVLDSDVSSGENNLGEYFVFVEIERSAKLTEQIKEITYGVRRLTGIADWQFRYHKSAKIHELTSESIKKNIPLSSPDYDGLLRKIKTNEVKQFFTKTLMDDFTLSDDNIITIHKPYNQKIQFQLVNEGDSEQVLENIEGSLSLDNNAMGEIFWLTKVLGNYNINKIGDAFVFENGNKSMILKRVTT